ncbi:hypothetical protein V8E51_014624 [Hyaloscypha variabilis]
MMVTQLLTWGCSWPLWWSLLLLGPCSGSNRWWRPWRRFPWRGSLIFPSLFGPGASRYACSGGLFNLKFLVSFLPIYLRFR